MHILTYKTRIEEIRRESFIEIKEVGEGKGKRKREKEKGRETETERCKERKKRNK